MANGGKLSHSDWLAVGKPSNKPVRVVPEGDRYDAAKQREKKLEKSKKASQGPKEIELDNKGRFKDKYGNKRDNAGPNAPKYQSWKESGGTVKYDEVNDSIIYGKSKMETSTMGTRDVEVAYKPGPPDGQRYPDFSELSKESVEIEGMKGLPESKIDLPETGDFSKAWRELEKQKGGQYIKDIYGINKRAKGKRVSTWPDKPPRGNTWHHNGNGSTMELLDYEVHKTFTHAGGASTSR